MPRAISTAKEVLDRGAAGFAIGRPYALLLITPDGESEVWGTLWSVTLDTKPRVLPGVSAPLGATWDGSGTNFAIYSENATGIELCLVDSEGLETRVPLQERTEFVWHCRIEDVGPGQLYGYRVHGPWEPRSGLRFNPANRLLDPYAKAVSGVEDWSRGVFSYQRNHPDADLARSDEDARGAPLAVVVDTTFDWEGDAPPATPLRDSILYECHVRGLTMRHPDVPEALRGTYPAIGTAPMLRYLSELGVTAVELLPVHQFVDDLFLLEKGLRNYWGYNSIGYFAPEVRYRAGNELASEVRQFKEMVKSLHGAGIEVILDVVYNHTAEGNHLGPTFSFKGVDNPTYYRLAEDRRYYFDYTGTGNSLNVRHPQTLRLIMDSLRYWITEMHVDGFRFDLASTLARNLHEVDMLSGFFTIINQDPIIRKAKLIAEPWDVGEGGYQVGQFPVNWAEWNGKFRDGVRRFWRDGCCRNEIALRLTGSPDLYQQGGRTPAESINLVTTHDGFTLRDLVSYDRKHNEANLEDNRDGADDNLSWNCGVEGETEDAEIRRLRTRQMKNLLATLLLSRGTPMLCGGDEIGRTQRGNNNAYSQDNEISWYDWELHEEARELLSFTRRLIDLRKRYPVLRRSRFVGRGEDSGSGKEADIAWFRQDGQLMIEEDWRSPERAPLGVFFSGTGLDETDALGRPLRADDLAMLFNPSDEDIDFVHPVLGEGSEGRPWKLLLDTDGGEAAESIEAGTATRMRSRSLKVFARRAASASGLSSVYGAAVSTYRIQLQRGFGFREAREIQAYLSELGVGGVYSSPYLRAESGSTHGYNVVDHGSLNPELGAVEDYRAWTDAMKDRGLRHIADFVPNHVGIGSGENRWWLDVLENGPSSEYADFFDIDWEPPTGPGDKVLLPVLSGQFGEELEAGRLQLARDGGRFWLTYFDRRFPLALESYASLLAEAGRALPLPGSEAAAQELGSILRAIEHLPASSARSDEDRAERAREREVIQRRLSSLCESSSAVSESIDDALRRVNADPAALEEVVLQQSYRLSYWRVATEEINYRRFFDVIELAAIRMEDPRVFEAVHELVFQLMAEGNISSIRLDHTDGLFDPEAYFSAFQEGARRQLLDRNVPIDAPLYVVAEKILQGGEELPHTWAISGTTGYDFLGAINGVWVDPDGVKKIARFYSSFTGDDRDFATVVYESKKAIMDTSMASEIQMLSHALKRIAERNRRARDFTLASLNRAVKETIAALSVYRTYVRPDGSRRPQDEALIRQAIRLAKKRNRGMDPSVFDFLERVLFLEERCPEAVRLAMRFQQLTGPIMAKGVEDTAFYRYHPLAALNEVGGYPALHGTSVESLHAHNAAILARWPLSMTTTTTHDTKRSEDVRARLAVLSEIPGEWEDLVNRLRSLGKAYLSELEGEPAPSPNDEYLFYQTLVGALPFEGAASPFDAPAFSERLVACMTKSAREAKERTSWISPNPEYEESLQRFVRECLKDEELVGAVRALVRRIGTYGACNSLAQLAIRLASPGVPDVYQGMELFELSLVDPDNRRPVDYGLRARLLEDLDARGVPTPALATELLQSFEDGRVKLHLLRTGLRLRREEPALFLEGGYRPLEVVGSESLGSHVIAFERRCERKRLVCIAPRLPFTLVAGGAPWPLGDVWDGARIELSPDSWTNLFTGETFPGGAVPLTRIFQVFPVVWLASSA